MKKKQIIRLNESQLRRIVSESVKRVLNEKNNEFTFDNSTDLGYGKYRQDILYKGKQIGFLYYKVKNWFAPVEELYLLPDIDYGFEQGGHHKDTKGWINFKRFTDYEEALQHASNNFKDIVYLFENGDWD